MSLWPAKSETLVLALSAGRIQNTLNKAIRVENSLEIDTDEKIFNGKVTGNHFELSLIIKRPENFLPIVHGNIEATSTGSIVFLNYTLFFSTRMFLFFWSVVTILLAFYLIVIPAQYIYAIISFGTGILNYAVAVANFNIQVKKTHEKILEVLSC